MSKEKLDSNGAIEIVDRQAEAVNPLALSTMKTAGRAVATAKAVGELRRALDVLEPELKELQGSRLGFLTDKDRNGGYAMPVVKECATEAILRGLGLTGNTWNIIAGDCYVTLEGYEYLVRQCEIVTDLQILHEEPEKKGAGYVVPTTIEYKVGGKQRRVSARYTVRAHDQQGLGAAAAASKARRLALKHVYHDAMGTPAPGDEPGGFAEEIPLSVFEHHAQQFEQAPNLESLANAWNKCKEDWHLLSDPERKELGDRKDAKKGALMVVDFHRRLEQAESEADVKKVWGACIQAKDDKAIDYNDFTAMERLKSERLEQFRTVAQ